MTLTSEDAGFDCSSRCEGGGGGGLYLITEDLDLAGGSVQQLVGSRAEVVGVDLQVEGEALHSLLRGEVRAQGVDADVNLDEEKGKRTFGL